MPHYDFLVIGGGMTAHAAIQGIREVRRDGSIGLIGREPDPPYNRPPLTKGLWKGKPLERIWRRLEPGSVDLRLGRTARSLDPADKKVVDDLGGVHTFDKLLLATGGTPRRLPFDGDRIIYYRTLADYRRLRSLTDGKERFAVIGGGFIGSEIAAALRMNGKDVVMIFPEDGICARLFPRDLSDFVTRYYGEKGVAVMPGESIEWLEERGDRIVLSTAAKKEIIAGGVVAGIGIRPNTDLAEEAGLATEDGIVVDEFLRTSHPDIYAAGDVASFHNPSLGKRLRVEHEDNANTMGTVAGRNMAGKNEPYHHLPFFYSDLFDLGYEAVGEIDPLLETKEEWKDPFREGVVYYLRDGRVRGILLWNVWGKVDEARGLIAEGRFRPLDIGEKVKA